MKKHSVHEMCRVAIIATVYVALTMVNPISWGTMQFRVANLVCVLPFIDKKYSPSILQGVAIANAFSPLGIIDVAFGVGTHAMCHALFVFGPGRKLPILAKEAALSIMVAVFIGAELTMLYGIPYGVNVVSLFASTAAILLAGTAVFAPMRKRGIL